MKFHEYDTVALTQDIAAQDLKAGETGTVLEARDDPEQYLVEFIHEEDDPLVALAPDQLRLVRRHSATVNV